MNRKRTWVIASIAAAVAMVLGACSTATTTTPPPQQTTSSSPPTSSAATTSSPPATTTPSVATTTSTASKPQYGGTLTLVYGENIMGFDSYTTPSFWDVAGHLTADHLLEGDWAKGPQGTDEYSWDTNDVYKWDSKSGALAQSWDLVGPGEIVLHIRQGVHYTLNTSSPASMLANGREMTGDDVYWNMQQWLTVPKSNIAAYAPEMAQSINMTQTDPWTIDVKVPPADFINVAANLVDWTDVYPPEVVKKYDMSDWHNNVGTGPYYLSDYVPSSEVTFQRNTNYWQTNPVEPGKGMQLPFVQTVKYLIISDESTIEAGIRTAKIDSYGGLTPDELQTLQSNTKDLQVHQAVPAAVFAITMHTNDANSPFSNEKVRQALTMGIDYNTIITQLYQGKAVLPSWPVTPEKQLSDVYIPMDQLPQNIQALYSYNPDQAKTLLAAGGYPHGFSCSIDYPTSNTAADYLSVIKEDWSQIGVNLTLNPQDPGVWSNEWGGRKYDSLFYNLAPSSGTYIMDPINGGTGPGDNMSFVNDPKVTQTDQEMLTAFGDNDQAKVDSLYKAFIPYALEQCWAIPTPAVYSYTVWWPWVEGYSGEFSPGVCDSYRWAKYVWIDQGLKTSMGH